MWHEHLCCAAPLLFVFFLTPFFVEYNTKNILPLKESVVVGFNDAGIITAVNDSPMFCWNQCANTFRLVEAESHAVIRDGNISRHITYRAQMRVTHLQKFFDYFGRGTKAVKNNDYGSMDKNSQALNERAQWSLDEFGYAKTQELAAFNDPLNPAQRAALENLLKTHLNTPWRLGSYGMEATRLLSIAVINEP